MHDSFRRMLTTYYHEDSGIGAALHSIGERPARVGVIGLGTGTIAAYDAAMSTASTTSTRA